MTLKWHWPGMKRKIQSHVRERLSKTAEMMKRRIQQKISTPAPPHSLPGNYPHLMTGQLHDSIKVFPLKSSSGKETIRFGSTAKHSKYVEASRPFLTRAVKESKREIMSILVHGHGVRKSGIFRTR